MTSKTLVETWYDAHAEMEAHRLDEGRLEFEVTMRVIKSCIADFKLEKARILDVGGGPGRYAIALAKQGHSVKLIYLYEKSLDIGRRNAEIEGVKLDDIVHANALDIAEKPSLKKSQGAFDIVLCLGPLYHLLSYEDRKTAIGNSILMAKPRGYILLAYVSVYAHLRDLANREPARLAKEWDFYVKYLEDGKYTRRADNESCHVYPQDLEGELSRMQEKVDVERVVSCEGFLGFEGARKLARLDEQAMEKWVDVILRSAEQRETWNSADHWLVALHKK